MFTCRPLLELLALVLPPLPGLEEASQSGELAPAVDGRHQGLGAHGGQFLHLLCCGGTQRLKMVQLHSISGSACKLFLHGPHIVSHFCAYWKRLNCSACNAGTEVGQIHWWRTVPTDTHHTHLYESRQYHHSSTWAYEDQGHVNMWWAAMKGMFPARAVHRGIYSSTLIILTHVWRKLIKEELNGED